MTVQGVLVWLLDLECINGADGGSSLGYLMSQENGAGEW